MAANTTSATLEEITGSEALFTTAGPSRIMVVMSLSSLSTGVGSNATGGWAIQINGVNGVEFQRFLSGANDRMMGSASMRSAILSAGTFSIKGMHRRVSGLKTVTTDALVLLCWPVAP
ncbi:MAG: hypothetical protein V3W41_22125 [Planctomycetota bacterium]